MRKLCCARAEAASALGSAELKKPRKQRSESGVLFSRGGKSARSLENGLRRLLQAVGPQSWYLQQRFPENWYTRSAGVPMFGWKTGLSTRFGAQRAHNGPWGPSSRDPADLPPGRTQQRGPLAKSPSGFWAKCFCWMPGVPRPTKDLFLENVWFLALVPQASKKTLGQKNTSGSL